MASPTRTSCDDCRASLFIIATLKRSVVPCPHCSAVQKGREAHGVTTACSASCHLVLSRSDRTSRENSPARTNAAPSTFDMLSSLCLYSALPCDNARPHVWPLEGSTGSALVECGAQCFWSSSSSVLFCSILFSVLFCLCSVLFWMGVAARWEEDEVVDDGRRVRGYWLVGLCDNTVSTRLCKVSASPLPHACATSIILFVVT